MFSTNKEFYENLTKRKLSDQEVYEARNNFVGFFDLLLKIDNRINNKNNAKNIRGANHSD